MEKPFTLKQKITGTVIILRMCRLASVEFVIFDFKSTIALSDNY